MDYEKKVNNLLNFQFMICFNYC